MASVDVLDRLAMNRLTLKTGILGFLLGSVMAACSIPNQNSTPAQAPTSSPMAGMNHDHSNMPRMSHGMMNLGPADADLDLRFIDAMIPHHQGAVEMAKEAQQKSKRPEIKAFAATIIKAQDKEIAEMKQWRQAWYRDISY